MTRLYILHSCVDQKHIPESIHLQSQTSQLAGWHEVTQQQKKNHQDVKLSAVHWEIQHEVFHSSQVLPVTQNTQQLYINTDEWKPSCSD